MTTVYKALPEGGYTSLPAASEVVVKRLVAQGWSLTPPVIAAQVAHDDLAVVVPAIDHDTVDDPIVALPRRGRKAKA